MTRTAKRGGSQRLRELLGEDGKSLLQPDSDVVLEIRWDDGRRQYGLSTLDREVCVVTYDSDGELGKWETVKLGVIVNMIELPDSEVSVLRETDSLPEKVKEFLHE